MSSIDSDDRIQSVGSSSLGSRRAKVYRHATRRSMTVGDTSGRMALSVKSSNAMEITNIDLTASVLAIEKRSVSNASAFSESANFAFCRSWKQLARW